MDIKNIKDMLRNSPFGCAYHKIVTDEKENPIDYIFIEVNKAFEELTGLKREDVINKKVTEIIKGIEKSDFNWIKFYGDIALNGGNKTFEQYSEGLKKWYKVQVYSSEKGFFSTVFVDITDMKEVSKKLKEAKEQFELAVNGTNDGIWDWNIKTGKLFLSKKWKEMLGYKDEELENKFETFISLLYEEDRKQVNEYVERYLNGEILKYSIEFRMKHKNGTLRWILAKGEAIRDDKGKPYRMAGSHSDITERKKSEEKLYQNEEILRMTLEITGEGTWEWEIETGKVKHNKRWCDILGLDHSFVKHSVDVFEKHIYQGDREEVFKKIKGSIEKGTRYESEHRMVKADGTIIWVNDRGGVAYKDKTGKAIRMIGSIADITDKKNSEYELRIALLEADALREKAELANKAKSEFLANMSHEIRTPLNAVIGFADLMLQTPLNDIQKQYAENIDISGRALLGIINDILDFSKIEAGKLELEIVKVDIEDILCETIDIIKYQASLKEIELLFDMQMDMPKIAEVDPVRLKQILINLMSNAIKFTKKGEVELKVIFKDIGNNKGKYLFSVRDTGIGIKEEQKEKLFKAFSQADSSTTRKFGGTGLGLIISNLLTEKMGSKIEVESKYGEGSVFYFEIELQYDETFQENIEEKLEIKEVLVVDDNDNNRIILEHNFIHWGINCVSCDNGLSALKILEKKEFDVIIVDYNMPYMNGIDTIKMIRDKLKLNSEKLPIILLHSSSDNQTIREECKKLGIKFNLVKPVKAKELYYFLKNIKNTDENEKIEEDKEKKLGRIDKTNDEITVLIVEDVAMNMFLAKTILKKLILNVNIIEAVNGIEAIEKIKQIKIDIILMDIQMPEMDGIEASKKIREMGYKIPIIALTAGAVKEEKEKALISGMDDFITKPIDKKQFNEIILKYLNLKVEDKSKLDIKKEENTMHFDKNEFLEVFEKDSELINEVIEYIKNKIPELILKLGAEILDKNITEIEFLSHSIKGQAVNMRFNVLGELAGEIEKNAHKGNLKNIEEDYERLKKEYEIVLKLIS